MTTDGFSEDRRGNFSIKQFGKFSASGLTTGSLTNKGLSEALGPGAEQEGPEQEGLLGGPRGQGSPKGQGLRGKVSMIAEHPDEKNADENNADEVVAIMIPDNSQGGDAGG